MCCWVAARHAGFKRVPGVAYGPGCRGRPRFSTMQSSKISDKLTCKSLSIDWIGAQATLIGSRILIFGGEDFARRPQSDLYILDMADTAWRTPDPPHASDDSSAPSPAASSPASSQGPSARSAHVAACVGGRYACAKPARRGHKVETDTGSWGTTAICTLSVLHACAWASELALRRSHLSLRPQSCAVIMLSPSKARRTCCPHTACSTVCPPCRFLLIFGGGSVAHCFNDIWCLDTNTMVWSRPPTAGEPPCPRAGDMKSTAAEAGSYPYCAR